jgi:hypothetical protein
MKMLFRLSAVLLAAVHEDALKYIPGKYDDVKKQLDAGREHFKKEEYAQALASVKDVPAKALELAKLADEAKKKYLEVLAKDWTDVNASVPGLMASVETRVNDTAKLKKLPAWVDQAKIDFAKDLVSRAKTAWDDAGKRYAAGDLEVAVAKAKECEALSNKALEVISPPPPAEPAAAAAPSPQAK